MATWPEHINLQQKAVYGRIAVIIGDDAVFRQQDMGTDNRSRESLTSALIQTIASLIGPRNSARLFQITAQNSLRNHRVQNTATHKNPVLNACIRALGKAQFGALEAANISIFSLPDAPEVGIPGDDIFIIDILAALRAIVCHKTHKHSTIPCSFKTPLGHNAAIALAFILQ